MYPVNKNNQITCNPLYLLRKTNISLK